MSQSSLLSHWFTRRAPLAQTHLRAAQCLVIAALLCAGWTSVAEAQSWSSPRTRPLLRQLVSVDASGETIWPYGGEDIAGDGASSFAADEAGTDVRSVYADANAQRVWLRAYVAGDAKPPQSLVAFFFADTDDRDATGGPAYGTPLSPAWTSDPTPGGYERAIGVRGDGTLLGVWSWEANTWTKLKPRKDEARVELGRDEDPLRIGIRVHGYAQVDVVHELSGLTESCAGNLFVRTWHDEAAPRSFGDDDAEVFACRPPEDSYGDPAVIRTVRCDADTDCPNDGRCRDRVCLFAAPCNGDGDCRDDERCTLGSCIRVVDDPCTASAECNGLVCENGLCVACNESGARACGDSLACSPNGTCIDPGNYVPGPAEDGAGGAGGADAGVVRGGAFHCAVQAANDRGMGAWLLALASALFLRRSARRDGRAS